VSAGIKEVEVARDAVLKKPAPAYEAERMIRSLVDMRAIGPELATLLVREAFSRPIANRRALGCRLPKCDPKALETVLALRGLSALTGAALEDLATQVVAGERTR
jgi:hypothetical protein